ncbi:hypothetical protein SAMN05216570_3070 [Dyella sp. OK004]|uniref:hypothetical protein n=1 Tax=Dyella sp. OK004 TaxID=1855292 RepID=UPI0008E09C3E|nr:hypothetical protein [Dyella sp. OK004]SFS14356.1 hypothetical protein SAMN05216570_3070 [Dyella sp. OK004]
MSDPMQAVLQPNFNVAQQFPITSRYYAIDTTIWSGSDGKLVPYLRRRFLPSPDQLQSIDCHVVAQNERLDNIAAQALGDPLQFWRLCDANNAMRPDALTEVMGRRLRITLPAGVIGPVA